MFIQKKIKETERNHAHTEIWANGMLMGYFIKNNSSNAGINENWNFCSNNRRLPFFHTRTRQEMLDKLTELIN